MLLQAVPMTAGDQLLLCMKQASLAPFGSALASRAAADVSSCIVLPAQACEAHSRPPVRLAVHPQLRPTAKMAQPAPSLRIVCLVAALAFCAAASAPAPAPGMLQALVPTTAPGALLLQVLAPRNPSCVDHTQAGVQWPRLRPLQPPQRLAWRQPQRQRQLS